MKNLSVVFITGLSGSGKSNAIKCFEDLGFFCVDNLPTALLPKFTELCAQSGNEINRVAIGIDVRERGFFKNFLEILDELKKENYAIEILFLEASDEALVRRFSETRRPHPLAKNGSVIDGIRLEREMLSELRKRADKIIDTTNYSVHQLKEILNKYYLESEGRKLTISFISFGYKFGIPYDVDLIFDVRFMQNPNFVKELKLLKGSDKRVIDYILKFQEAKAFLEKLYEFLRFLIPMYEKEGKSYLTIGIGCTGGRHRSVAVSEILKGYLEKEGYSLNIKHRDIEF
ncbi:MAG: RNase adaptor protein RapZ [Nitrospirae bacterium RBG_19FT_COMBO_42_15]|nr:MAG: RNase adaptor protein RapZ [Nitrospirae bacterium RBG_19FT_COMBO_42_15]